MHTFSSTMADSACECDYIGGKCYCKVKRPSSHHISCRSIRFIPANCNCKQSIGHPIDCRSRFIPENCDCMPKDSLHPMNKNVCICITTGKSKCVCGLNTPIKESNNNKHSLDPEEKEQENEQPDTKKIKLLAHDYEVHHEWFEDPSLATLTVDVCLYVTDDDYNNKQQTHLLHLHCVPGVLAIHSEYFKAMITPDPKLALIEMPESFTYRCTHKVGSNGEVTINKQEVIALFNFFHAKGELEQINNRFSLMFMLFYINSPLFKKVEQAVDITGGSDPVSYLNWAGYFKSDRLYSQICKRLKKWSYQDNENNKKLIPLIIKSVPRDVLDRVMTDLCFL